MFKTTRSRHEQNEVKEVLVLNTDEAEISEDSFVEGRNGDIQFEEEKQHDLKSDVSSEDSGFREFLQFVGR